MRRGWAGILLGLLGVAGVAAPQAPPAQPPPFWEAKPYGEWTPAETLTILTDSPWSRAATVVEPGVGQRSGKIRYYAQWYSAQTVREALVRLRNLYGRPNPEADAQSLAASPTAYQIFVYAAVFDDNGEFHALPLDIFDGMTSEELQQAARLVFSSQEYSSRPDIVELVPEARTQRVAGLRLTFERARGALPPADAGKGQVRLVCPTRQGSLSVTFQLEQMQHRGQPDL